MNIAIDLDGVLCDFNYAFARLCMKIEPSTHFDPTKSSFPAVWDWPEYYGISSETVEKAWVEVKNCGHFWKFLFPYPNAWEDLQYLSEIRMDHNLYFVTDRPGRTAKRESEEWLRQHGFHEATVIICGNKPLLCEALKIGLIIDDKPANLEIAKGTPVLFKRPYNESYWMMFITTTTVREAVKNAVS